MRFSLLTAVVALAAFGQAQNICFDAGDCIFAAGHVCVKKPGQITGTCQKSASTLTTKVATTTKAPTKTSSAAPGKVTGAICFDDFDCIFTGGKCVRTGSNVITGNCKKA